MKEKETEKVGMSYNSPKIKVIKVEVQQVIAASFSGGTEPFNGSNGSIEGLGDGGQYDW